MAFTIRIYETDEYIYSLLKKRLGSFYPDAYIVNPCLERQDEDDRFSDFTKVIYDPSCINKDDIPSTAASPIRLTEDGGIIDCSRLISMLLPRADVPSVNQPLTGTLTAVIPFVYSDVRDRFIFDLESGLSEADYNIRLDFTSRLRALWRGSPASNMTALLKDCKSRRFMPEDILKYCNMDDSGFLTPGSCKNNDDVYDLGIERSTALMNHASDLAHSRQIFVNVLAVVEGFRTADLPGLLAGCDKVFILLPAKNASEDIGARDLITMLTKVLGKERISVRYAEDFAPGSEFDDVLSQRSLAV